MIATLKENLFHWEIIIEGPIGSPYEGFKFVVDIDFPEQFPFKFPQFKFRTPIYHPNIKDGLMCQEMLGEKEWLPNKKVKDIIETMLGMLAHPDVNSAINIEAAEHVKKGTFYDVAREKATKDTQK